MCVKITEFFANANILLTGATGFLGKAVLEKLLRSQTNIKKIYILIRPKNGTTIEQSVEDMFENHLFKKLKDECEKYMDKIVVLEGNLCEKGLGLSEKNRYTLINEVNIIYNCASSTNLKTLKDNVKFNTKSVKELLELCRQMRKLKSVVLISTIYTNCLQEVIEEKLYKTEISASLILKLCEEMDEKLVEKIAQPLLGRFSNSYIYSKALMESLVLEKYSDLPVVVFRSGIVISSYQEPLPGWIEDKVVPVKMAYLVNLGILRVLNFDDESKLHLVPLDFCANALICSSWHGVKKRAQGGPQIFIYNYAIEKRKRTWRFYLRTTLDCDIKLGSAIWKPLYISPKNIYIYYISRFFLHFLPAVFMDAGLSYTGQAKRYLKMYEDIYENCEVLAYFINNELRCKENNTLEMLNDMALEEQELYPFDGNKIDCGIYAKRFCTGMKLYLANEKIEDNEKHLSRHKMLSWLHLSFQVTFLGLISLLLFAIFLIK